VINTLSNTLPIFPGVLLVKVRLAVVDELTVMSALLTMPLVVSPLASVKV
jgi:hypothetical protein